MTMLTTLVSIPCLAIVLWYPEFVLVVMLGAVAYDWFHCTGDI